MRNLMILTGRHDDILTAKSEIGSSFKQDMKVLRERENELALSFDDPNQPNPLFLTMLATSLPLDLKIDLVGHDPNQGRHYSVMSPAGNDNFMNEPESLEAVARMIDCYQQDDNAPDSPGM